MCVCLCVSIYIYIYRERERERESMTGLENNTDLNRIEKFWWKFWKMVQVKISSSKVDLLIAIREGWKSFNKEYFSRLEKSMSERIKVAWKAGNETTQNPVNTYSWCMETLDRCFDFNRSHQQCKLWSPTFEIEQTTTNCSAENLQLSHQFI